MSKPKIMVFCDSYLPGYASGGAMRMVLNIVDRFYDRYDFFVVTRNYDSKSNPAPYTEVDPEKWNITGNAKVFYLRDDEIRRSMFARLGAEVQPDLVFMNSTFSTPAVVYLWSRWRGDFRNIPVIVSPCGSLAPACLQIKALKKLTYLNLSKLTGFYDGVIWKASSEQERQEIELVFGETAQTVVAPDLTPLIILPEFSLDQKPVKTPGSVKFVYFSRIEIKKNLKFLLECLETITSGKIDLKVIGPVDDEDYWNDCRKIIGRLPTNISVNHLGARPQRQALLEMTEGHFFVLPTQNENFGYVFLESLSAGCPNITSDQTVWTDLEGRNAGWRIPLSDTQKWVAVIKKCVEMDDSEFRQMASAARNYAVAVLTNDANEAKTELAFQKALKRETGETLNQIIAK